jgi:hypothetical protein
MLHSYVSQIETKIPHYWQHQDHWGIDTLLQDQLKSMKDVASKVARKERKGKKTKVNEPDSGMDQ